MITFFDGSAIEPRRNLIARLQRSIAGIRLRETKQGLFAVVRERLAKEFPQALRIGLIAPTGPDLIEAWDACLHEGREPMVLHYPTAKLSRIYWNEAMANAIRTVELDVLISADRSCRPNTDVPVIMLDELPRSGRVELGRAIPPSGAILQMSSGTTGHRKGIRYTLADIRTHVAEYNKVLGLTKADKVVSWLPLYHDMGYIAAFIMPRLLGVDLILMDPMDWGPKPRHAFRSDRSVRLDGLLHAEFWI